MSFQKLVIDGLGARRIAVLSLWLLMLGLMMSQSAFAADRLEEECPDLVPPCPEYCTPAPDNKTCEWPKPDKESTADTSKDD